MLQNDDFFVFIAGWSLNRLKGFIERRKWVTGLSLFGWCYVVWPRGMNQSPSKWPKQYQLFTKLMTLSICVLSVLGQKAPSTLWMRLNGWVQHHLVTGRCDRHITKSGALTKWGRKHKTITTTGLLTQTVSDAKWFRFDLSLSFSLSFSYESDDF